MSSSAIPQAVIKQLQLTSDRIVRWALNCVIAIDPTKDNRNNPHRPDGAYINDVATKIQDSIRRDSERLLRACYKNNIQIVVVSGPNGGSSVGVDGGDAILAQSIIVLAMLKLRQPMLWQKLTVSRAASYVNKLSLVDLRTKYQNQGEAGGKNNNKVQQQHQQHHGENNSGDGFYAKKFTIPEVVAIVSIDDVVSFAIRIQHSLKSFIQGILDEINSVVDQNNNSNSMNNTEKTVQLQTVNQISITHEKSIPLQQDASAGNTTSASTSSLLSSFPNPFKNQNLLQNKISLQQQQKIFPNSTSSTSTNILNESNTNNNKSMTTPTATTIARAVIAESEIVTSKDVSPMSSLGDNNNQNTFSSSETDDDDADHNNKKHVNIISGDEDGNNSNLLPPIDVVTSTTASATSLLSQDSLLNEIRGSHDFQQNNKLKLQQSLILVPEEYFDNSNSNTNHDVSSLSLLSLTEDGDDIPQNNNSNQSIQSNDSMTSKSKARNNVNNNEKTPSRRSVSSNHNSAIKTGSAGKINQLLSQVDMKSQFCFSNSNNANKNKNTTDQNDDMTKATNDIETKNLLPPISFTSPPPAKGISNNNNPFLTSSPSSVRIVGQTAEDGDPSDLVSEDFQYGSSTENTPLERLQMLKMMSLLQLSDSRGKKSDTKPIHDDDDHDEAGNGKNISSLSNQKHDNDNKVKFQVDDSSAEKKEGTSTMTMMLPNSSATSYQRFSAFNQIQNQQQQSSSSSSNNNNKIIPATKSNNTTTNNSNNTFLWTAEGLLNSSGSVIVPDITKKQQINNNNKNNSGNIDKFINNNPMLQRITSTDPKSKNKVLLLRNADDQENEEFCFLDDVDENQGNLNNGESNSSAMISSRAIGGIAGTGLLLSVDDVRVRSIQNFSTLFSASNHHHHLNKLSSRSTNARSNETKSNHEKIEKKKALQRKALRRLRKENEHDDEIAFYFEEDDGYDDDDEDDTCKKKRKKKTKNNKGDDDDDEDGESVSSFSDSDKDNEDSSKNANKNRKIQNKKQEVEEDEGDPSQKVCYICGFTAVRRIIMKNQDGASGGSGGGTRKSNNANSNSNNNSISQAAINRMNSMMTMMTLNNNNNSASTLNNNSNVSNLLHHSYNSHRENKMIGTSGFSDWNSLEKSYFEMSSAIQNFTSLSPFGCFPESCASYNNNNNKPLNNNNNNNNSTNEQGKKSGKAANNNNNNSRTLLVDIHHTAVDEWKDDTELICCKVCRLWFHFGCILPSRKRKPSRTIMIHRNKNNNKSKNKNENQDDSDDVDDDEDDDYEVVAEDQVCTRCLVMQLRDTSNDAFGKVCEDYSMVVYNNNTIDYVESNKMKPALFHGRPHFRTAVYF